MGRCDTDGSCVGGKFTDWMFMLIFSMIVLTQLDVGNRSPADKAAIIVAAHKVVVG